MKKLIIGALVVTSFTSFAGDSLTCRSLSGNAINVNDQKTETKTVTKNSVIRFENNSLVSTVQFMNGKLIQLMVESTKTHTFTQSNMQRLVESGKGEIFLQDLMSNGDYMEVSCEVN